MPKDELIEIDLELALANAVMGADQPLLQVADRPIGKGDGGVRTLTQFCPKRLDSGDVLKAGLLETFEALEAIRIDRRTECNIFG